MPIEPSKTKACYIPSLASRRAWDNPKLADWNEVEIKTQISTSTSTSKRGRIYYENIEIYKLVNGNL